MASYFGHDCWYLYQTFTFNSFPSSSQLSRSCHSLAKSLSLLSWYFSFSFWLLSLWGCVGLSRTSSSLHHVTIQTLIYFAACFFFSPQLSSFSDTEVCLVSGSPVHATAKRPQTGPIWTNLDRTASCRLRTFQIEGPQLRNQLQPVLTATGSTRRQPVRLVVL